MRANMSILFLGLFVIAVVLIPARYSAADEMSTRTETFRSGSDMGPPPGTSEYESKTETFHRSDADVPPPAGSDYQYQYRSEHRESHEVAPAPPAVVEHDRTIVEHDVPAPPREGRLQAWWHRNFHRDSD